MIPTQQQIEQAFPHLTEFLVERESKVVWVVVEGKKPYMERVGPLPSQLNGEVK